MYPVLKMTAVLALVSACAAPTPEQRAARVAQNADISAQVSQGMARPAPAAIGECLRQVETGAFSEANLLAAGFNKGSSFGAGAYNLAVSGPVKQGFSERPLMFGVNIGPSTAVNFQPGCRMNLPSQGGASLAIARAASQAAAANGYTLNTRRGGVFIFQKGALSVRMTVTRTVGNGVNALSAMVRQSNS